MENAVKHKPYIPSETVIPELTFVPMLLGTVLGVLFGVASLYLALKVGMTVSASIPVAVMSISIFRWASRVFKARNATILENNIVQTVGSAGESIAFSIAATMPALMILGHDMDLSRIMTVAILGGLLGILMMIPLRRGLIVKEHGKLMYPEGTACADILIAGEKGGTNAKTVFTGFGVGFLFKLLCGDGGLGMLKGVSERTLSWFKGALVSTEIAPELMGVGYIIGPRIAGITTAGSVLAYLVLIPAIKIFGEGLSTPVFPATKLISEMGPNEIRRAYVLYIGAGAVAAAGIISMFRVMPTIISAFAAGFRDLLETRGGKATQTERVDRDLSMPVVALGSLLLVVCLWSVPSMHLNLLGAALIILAGFLFVTVSSRITGEIGSSNNPISGMTVATLLLTCLIFVAFNWTTPTMRVAALMIAAVVCIAASNGGTTSQDLKTGFLVGATPRSQQIGILIGAMASALCIGYALKVFNDMQSVAARRDFPGFRVEQVLFEPKQQIPNPVERKRDKDFYNVVHFIPENAPKNVDGTYRVPPGKYLVDDAGSIRYLVDPGIYGVVTNRDPEPGQTKGAEVKKFDAPQARLMSLIIDGILTKKLPWGLVLLGVFIAIVLEMSCVPALAFAVGVYLPLSTTAPLGIGGLVHYLVRRRSSKGGKTDTQSEFAPGVLCSSGLIAGGAISGMLLAIVAGLKGDAEFLSRKMPSALTGLASSDLVALLAFLVLGVFVYLVGREKLLKSKA